MLKNVRNFGKFSLTNSRRFTTETIPVLNFKSICFVFRIFRKSKIDSAGIAAQTNFVISKIV